MVSFVCDVCQDVIKKPKLENHKARCPGATFTCIDCNTHFEGDSYKTHTQCISEQQKYMGKFWPGNKKTKQNSTNKTNNSNTGSSSTTSSNSTSSTTTTTSATPTTNNSNNNNNNINNIENKNESHNKSVSLSTSEKELNQKKRKRENRENEASEESVSTTKRPKQEKTEPTDTISSTSVKRDEGDHHQNIVHSNEEAESHLINVDTLRWSKLMKRTLKKSEGRRMKLKALQEAVVSEMLNRVRPLFESAFLKALSENSKKFQREGKYIVLM